MKKILCIILVVLLMSLLVSCSVAPVRSFPMLYGKWRNSALSLTLDVKPNPVAGEPDGEYWINGERKPVFLIVSHFPHFSININDTYYDENMLFSGSFTVKDGKMYYKINSNFQEKMGIKDTIVFEKIGEYEID